MRFAVLLISCIGVDLFVGVVVGADWKSSSIVSRVGTFEAINDP